jgi:hypothetical protein
MPSRNRHPTITMIHESAISRAVNGSVNVTELGAIHS